MSKLNNRGFTLIELLVSVAIMGVILTLAYTGITSYYQKGAKKILESKIEMLKTAAIFYVEDNYNELARDICSIPTEDLSSYIEADVIENGIGYLTDLKKKKIVGYIVYDRLENSYSFKEDSSYEVCLGGDGVK